MISSILFILFIVISFCSIDKIIDMFDSSDPYDILKVPLYMLLIFISLAAYFIAKYVELLLVGK